MGIKLFTVQSSALAQTQTWLGFGAVLIAVAFALGALAVAVVVRRGDRGAKRAPLPS